jgi:hypothetical protein
MPLVNDDGKENSPWYYCWVKINGHEVAGETRHIAGQGWMVTVGNVKLATFLEDHQLVLLGRVEPKQLSFADLVCNPDDRLNREI